MILPKTQHIGTRHLNVKHMRALQVPRGQPGKQQRPLPAAGIKLQQPEEELPTKIKEIKVIVAKHGAIVRKFKQGLYEASQKFIVAQ